MTQVTNRGHAAIVADAAGVSDSVLDAIVRDELEVHVFAWSRNHGDCYDCGAPAAFQLGAVGAPAPSSLRCAMCAAQAAADGEYIERIEED